MAAKKGTRRAASMMNGRPKLTPKQCKFRSYATTYAYDVAGHETGYRVRV